LALTGCSKSGEEKACSQKKRYIKVELGTHPSLLFPEQEVEDLKQKTNVSGLPRQMWKRLNVCRITGQWMENGSNWAWRLIPKP